MAYAYKGKMREISTPATRAKCGTDSGYHTHKRLKTDVCGPCYDAHVAYRRKWQQRHAGPIMRTTCATYPGYMRHKRAGESPCELCLNAYAQYMRDYRARKQAA
jgi:hypothetical protein